METTTSSDPRPRYTSRAYLRAVVDHFANEWRGTNGTTRLYVAGIALIFTAGVAIRLHAPSWWVAGQLLLGATLASAGFVLEAYKVVDWLWETKLGKLVGVLAGTMVAAVAMALAQLIVNDATGIDPGHFPLTIAFMAPLTAGYLIAVIAWLAVIAGLCWTFVEILLDMVQSGWAFSWGRKHVPKNSTQTALRFVAVVIFSLLLAVMWSEGQRPYASFLSGTARWFAFGLEMYGSDACRLPNGRVRRLNDELVADGIASGKTIVFRVRQCPFRATVTSHPAAQ